MKMLAAALLAASSPPNAGPVWKCHFQRDSWCDTGGCHSRPASKDRWIYLYPAQGRYWRCRTKEFGACDEYEASLRREGDVTIMEADSGTISARVEKGLKVIETLAGTDGGLSSHGQCRSAPAPLVRAR